MLHRLLGSYFISMLYIIEAESQYVHDSLQFVKHTKLCRQSTQHRCRPGGWPFSRRRNVSVETTLSSASLSSRVQHTQPFLPDNNDQWHVYNAQLSVKWLAVRHGVISIHSITTTLHTTTWESLMTSTHPPPSLCCCRIASLISLLHTFYTFSAPSPSWN